MAQIHVYVNPFQSDGIKRGSLLNGNYFMKLVRGGQCEGNECPWEANEFIFPYLLGVWTTNYHLVTRNGVHFKHGFHYFIIDFKPME